MSNKQLLIQSILQVLQNDQSSKSSAVVDAQALSTAMAQLSKAYGGVTATSANAVDLAALFDAHVKEHGIVGSNSGNSNIDNDPKFIEFINLLKGKGYFKSVDEGSEQYKDRLAKAKEKYLERNKPAAGASAASATAATAVDTVRAEKLKDEGNELLRQKRFREAIDKYKEALKYNPQSHVYYTNMAAAHLHLRDYDSAMDSCEKALAINDKYSKAYKWLAQTYESQDKFKEALENYEQAQRLEPDNDDFKRKVQQMQRRLAEAEAAADDDVPDLTDNSGNVIGAMPPGMGGMGMGGGGMNNPMAAMFGGMNPMEMLSGMGLGGMGGGGGMPDLGSLLGNPQFMEFASNMMQNPQMRQMVSGMASQMGINMDENGVPQLSAEQLDEIAQDPSVQASPKLQRVVEEMRVAGMEALRQYEGDEDVMQFVQGVLQRITQAGMAGMGGMGGLGGLGGMFGGR